MKSGAQKNQGEAEFDQHHPDVVVGSSRGGAVATSIDSGTISPVRLCPAWKRWRKVTTVKPNSVILHARADDVVPFDDSEQLVRNSGMRPAILIEIGTDHRLADPEAPEIMLKVVERYGSALTQRPS